MPKITITLCDAGGVEEQHELPALRVLCSRCGGKGYHVNPAVDGHGLSAEDFAEDPDFERDYFAGVYDVRCEECDGEKVVLELDRDRVDASLLKRYDAQQAELSFIESIEEAERRMGA